MPAAKEKPILFSGPMVRAILDGRKTQTRRVVHPQPPHLCRYAMNGAGSHILCLGPNGEFVPPTARSKDHRLRCPFGPPGTLLWVREKARIGSMSGMGGKTERVDIIYAEPFRDRSCIKSFPRSDWRPYSSFESWTPSIHMPRWASRITLRVKRTWVERVQDISEEDARAEGITDGGCLNCGKSEPCGCANPEPDAKDAFAWLWQSTYPGSWDANQWVWACEFEKVPNAT